MNIVKLAVVALAVLATPALAAKKPAIPAVPPAQGDVLEKAGIPCAPAEDTGAFFESQGFVVLYSGDSPGGKFVIWLNKDLKESMITSLMGADEAHMKLCLLAPLSNLSINKDAVKLFYKLLPSA